MRIILEDGSSHEVSKTDQWKIVYGELLVNPRPIPRRMKKIWDRPPTYAPRLVPIDCLNLAPGHYVMTTLGPKLIREIIRNERSSTVGASQAPGLPVPRVSP